MTKVPLSIMSANFCPGAGQPLPHQAGSAVLVEGYLFDASGIKALQMALRVPDDYASGGTLAVPWFGQSATSGDVAIGVSFAKVTANDDDVDMEGLAWGAETIAVDSHLGTTAKRPHSIDVTPTDDVSMAAGDSLLVRVRRHGGSGGDGDTLADSIVIQDPVFSYTAA